jgi:hypothetical protein
MDIENTPIARHSKVLVELIDLSGVAEQVRFMLVASKQADFNSGLLDENTPLGRALIGHQVGEVVPYKVGDLKEVRILSVEHGGTADASPEAAEKRRETVRKATAQSEIINQLNFATASGSKWGDYDVDVEKLMDQRQEEKDKETPEACPPEIDAGV